MVAADHTVLRKKRKQILDVHLVRLVFHNIRAPATRFAERREKREQIFHVDLSRRQTQTN